MKARIKTLFFFKVVGKHADYIHGAETLRKNILGWIIFLLIELRIAVKSNHEISISKLVFLFCARLVLGSISTLIDSCLAFVTCKSW